MKSKKSLGWYIAIFLIVPIIVVLINLLFFSPTNDASKYVDSYINNSIDIDILTDENVLELDESFTINTGIRQVFQRTRLQSAICRSFKVYGSDYGKYFRVILIGAGNSIHSQYLVHYSLIPGALIRARINKDDLNNPDYGSKDNPIPVLMLDIPSHKGWNDYEEEAITEEQYRVAVYYYLSYIMPKEEFNRRFKSSDE